MRYFAVLALITALAILTGCGGDNSSLVTRPSGVQYKDVVVGTGEVVPNGAPTGMEVIMKLENGTVVYDSATAEKPNVFTHGVNDGILPGIKEGLMGIRYGAQRTIIVPPELAYGDQGNADLNIPPKATLICDVRLCWNKTESGIQYLDIIEGTGAVPQSKDLVKIHYTLWDTGGVKRESSRDPGREPFEFVIDGDPEDPGAIEGMEETVLTMKVGGKRRLVMPPSVAYKDGRSLVFEVELLETGPKPGSEQEPEPEPEQ